MSQDDLFQSIQDILNSQTDTTIALTSAVDFYA